MNETFDVIVVGAGVQGSSLAFHLAKRGARVVVLERESVASGATGRSSGFVRMHYDVETDADVAPALAAVDAVIRDTRPRDLHPVEPDEPAGPDLEE